MMIGKRDFYYILKGRWDMKRLASFVMGQEPNDDSYAKMYEGAMYDALAVPCGETVYEAVY